VLQHRRCRHTDFAGHEVLLRVGRNTKAGCKTDNGACSDEYCTKDLLFQEYDKELCRDNFVNAIREACYGKGFSDDDHDVAGKPNSFGGSFFADCMMWTIVAGKPGDLPDDTIAGA
jgi:hypothetical protein